VGPETHLHKITNVPVFFIWRHYFTLLMRANPLLGPLEGVGPEKKISTFLCQNDTRFDRCYFMAQKSLDFQGQLLPMDAARIKIIMSYAM